MTKDPDLGGGIPSEILSAIVALMKSQNLPGGISKDDAINVLIRVIQEEHQAANPGSGVTGFWDATEAFYELREAYEGLKAATSGKPGQDALARLIAAIDAITDLWKVGGLMPGYFSSK